MEILKEFLFISYDYGYGYGSGYGIKKYNNMDVYKIDEMQTIVCKIKKVDNLFIAKGYILNKDFTLTQTFIVKQNNVFSHGKTLKEAVESLNNKLFEELSEEERIEIFLEKFDINEKYKGSVFFEWHGKLTGSCKQGRSSFVKNNNIDLEKLYNIKEFIELCENEYGSKIIKRLKESI